MSTPETTSSTDRQGIRIGNVTVSPAWRSGLLVFIPLIGWVGLVGKLRNDWSTNPQYEFGYFVPLFILYLLWRRWTERPYPSVSRPTVSAVVVGVVIMFLLLPIRIIQEANPDWRPFNWFHSIIIVILSLVPIAIAGGVRWVRHFTIPFLLIFSALPWPLAMEQGVLQALASAVTSVTVELLNLVNVPALQRGNVIDIASGSVGIADACSGIRSLAGTLMASLFFGEFYRLGLSKRIVLVAGGCAMSFGLNICRAFFLGWRAAVEGISSIEKWHDPAGFTIFFVSFALLWLFATLVERGGELSKLSTNSEFEVPSFRFMWITCGIVWMLSLQFIVELWYENQEGRRLASVDWGIHWPALGKSFTFEEIPPETRSILRYTHGQSARFDWEDGSMWQIFYFRWAPGRSSVQLAIMHRPEVCLPAIGYSYVDVADPLEISVSTVSIPLTGGVYECNGNRVYIYRCLWEDFPVPKLARNKDFDLSFNGRVLAAWYGRRNLGQKLFQVAIVGVNTEKEARIQLQRKLSDLIFVRG